MNKSLWIAQALLAAIFLFAGGMKLAMSSADLAAAGPFPVWFLRFVGVCEILGAFGVILPTLFGVYPALTSVAAGGLVILMIGATVFGIVSGMAVMALIPAITGLLAAFVAYGRWRRREAATIQGTNFGKETRWQSE
jgi:hypothetical protein